MVDKKEEQESLPAESDRGGAVAFMRQYFRAPLAASVSIIRSWTDRGADSREPQEVGHASRSWILLTFSGLGSAFLALVYGTLYGGAIYSDYATGIVIDPPILAASVADSGIDADDLLRRAIAGIPDRLRDYEGRFARGRAHLAQFPRLVELGQERYCPQYEFGRLFDFETGYFSDRTIIRPRAEMEVDRIGFPLVAPSLNLLRRLTGADHMTIRLNLREEDGHYLLATSIETTSGARNGPHLQNFDIPVLTPSADNLRHLIEEIVMRVAYPELTAPLRSARGRADLEIEGFVAREYPAPERELMLKAGLLAALANRQNYLTSHDDNRRQAFLLGEILALDDTGRATINRHELGVLMTRIQGRVLMPAGSPAAQAESLQAVFALAEDKWHERQAAEIGVKFADILANQSPERRFAPAERRLAEHRWLSRLNYSTDFSVITDYRHWLDESLAMARTIAPEQRNDVRSALHDAIAIYAASLYGKVAQTFDPAKGLTADARDQLEQLVQFHDSILTPVNGDWNLFEKDELEQIEILAAGSQLLLGETEDALARIDRIARTDSACVAALAGSQLSDLAAVVAPAQQRADLRRDLFKRSYALLKHAERRGMRSFQLYNIMGSAARQAGDIEAAIAAFDAAKIYDGEVPWALLNAGYALLEGRDFAAAEGRFLESIEASFRQCREDAATWNDVDERYNEAMVAAWEKARAEQGGQNDADPSVYLINQAPTEKGCSVRNAVYGLMDSLKEQGKTGEYLRTYNKFLSEPTDAALDPDAVRAALTNIRRWQCLGKMRETPAIAEEFSGEFPVVNGAFVCP